MYNKVTSCNVNLSEGKGLDILASYYVDSDNIGLLAYSQVRGPYAQITVNTQGLMKDELAFRTDGYHKEVSDAFLEVLWDKGFLHKELVKTVPVGYANADVYKATDKLLRVVRK